MARQQVLDNGNYTVTFSLPNEYPAMIAMVITGRNGTPCMHFHKVLHKEHVNDVDRILKEASSNFLSRDGRNDDPSHVKFMREIQDSFKRTNVRDDVEELREI